jgi:hypothetical protein
MFSYFHRELLAKRYAITGPNDESKEADDLTAYSYRLGILLYGEKTKEASNVGNAFRREAKPSAVFGKVLLYQLTCNTGDINTNIASRGPKVLKVKKGQDDIYSYIIESGDKLESDRLNYGNNIMTISLDSKCPEKATKQLGIN